MSDRELLPMAATAAGIKLLCWQEVAQAMRTMPSSGTEPAPYWNPLTDDGDALRLAVKLNLSVKVYGANTMCYDMDNRFLADFVDVEDPTAATRRAIVRAAVEIYSRSSATASANSDTGSTGGV